MQLFDPMEAWMSVILKDHYENAWNRANELQGAATLDDITGCLETTSKEPRKVRFMGKQMSAYRFIYFVYHGVALQQRAVVRHRCANRRCIQIGHLELGDRRDNKRDDWTHWSYGPRYELLPRG